MQELPAEFARNPNIGVNKLLAEIIEGHMGEDEAKPIIQEILARAREGKITFKEINEKTQSLRGSPGELIRYLWGWN